MYGVSRRESAIACLLICVECLLEITQFDLYMNIKRVVGFTR